MAKLYDLEPKVERILENCEEARKDNFILYELYLETIIDTRISVRDLFLNRADLGIPSLESLTRVRRKIQSRRPDLVDESARRVRKQEQQDFFEYALSE